MSSSNSLMTMSLIVSLLIVGLSANGYNLQSTAECVAFDVTYNVCSKWSQTGTIQPEDVDCFHGLTIVKEKSKGFI